MVGSTDVEKKQEKSDSFGYAMHFSSEDRTLTSVTCTAYLIFVVVVVVVVVVVFPLGTPFIGGRDSRPAMSLQCLRERCTVKPTVIEGQIYSWVRPLDTTFNLR